MRMPRFSIRTILIAAVLIGFVGIPAGHKQYLKWQQRGEVIPLFYIDAESVAAVLREVYVDRLKSGVASISQQSDSDSLSIAVDAKSNMVIVSGPKNVIREIRELASAIDASNSTTSRKIVLTMPIANPETIK
jgi:type II secretory pathway component GspD/PulD (secretin)